MQEDFQQLRVQWVFFAGICTVSEPSNFVSLE